MVQIRISTTSTEGLRPLGQEGQRSHEMITALLGSRLGTGHARLFAEPVAARGGSETDWYVQTEGAARPLAALSTEDQEKARTRLAALVADITQLADELAEAGGDSNARLSDALRNALEIPDESAVHVMPDGADGLQPVLVNWASVREDRQLFRGVLSGIAPKKAPAPPLPRVTPPPVAPQAQWVGAAPVALVPFGLGWLLWAVLGALLLAIVLLLITPCGLRGFDRLSFCTAAAGIDGSAALAEQAALADRIHALQLAMIRADQACPVLPSPPARAPVVEPSPPPPREPEPAPPAPDIESRLDPQSGQRGDMNVSLVWDTRSDLDSAVTCPNGVEISYSGRTPASCPGPLDIDANISRWSATTTSIENVFFENPALGTYEIEVTLLNRHAVSGDIPFTVQLLMGETTRRFTGTVGNANRTWRTRFDYEAQ
jgi:hypothetical protein